MTTCFKQESIKRRAAVFKKMNDNSVAIIPSATVKIRNKDCEYPYRQDSNFLYLTDFHEPESVLVLIKKNKQAESVIFCRPNNKNEEIWHGKRLGLSKARTTLHADLAFPIGTFEKQLENILQGKSYVYYPFNLDTELAQKVYKVLSNLKSQHRKGNIKPNQVIDLDCILHEMRKLKSEAEIGVIQQACDISTQAHIRAMKACRPRLYEYNLESEISHEFLSQGARYHAYNPIVASGNNACILHYTDNNKKIEDGELVLIDAGCELSGYASDLTRTFPANGRFNQQQKLIYELVLKAQKAAINAIKPGVPWINLQDIVIKTLSTGLVELGILKGEISNLINEKAYLPFYMHGHGHFLGLDVHDVGNMKKDKEWIQLQEGMVLTVEPGLYIYENEVSVDEKWQGIGVRIEDNVLVTSQGCQVLSEKLPKEIDEIEKLVNT